MTARSLLLRSCPLALLLCSALRAQDTGEWRPVSNTARSVTGYVVITDTKIILNFSGYTLAEIRSLQPAEASALFHDAPGAAEGSGHLYRTSIPGSKRFLHKNTLCGAEDVQWVASVRSGNTLQLALFSGSSMPTLTAEAVANTTSLCGTYSYTK